MTNLSEKSVRFSPLFCNLSIFLVPFIVPEFQNLLSMTLSIFMEQGLSPCSLFANNKLKTCATPDINF